MKTEEQKERDRTKSQEYRDKDRAEYNRKAREWRSKNADKVNARTRELRKIDPTRFREAEKRRYEKNPLRSKLQKYNISEEGYLNMVEAQKNKCCICEKDMKSVNIDHCHKTGKVRGLLCTACNTGIGKLKDDTSILQNAINYLTKYKEE